MIETLTKKEPSKATKPFISTTGHITIDELQQSLDRTSMANGSRQPLPVHLRSRDATMVLVAFRHGLRASDNAGYLFLFVGRSLQQSALGEANSLCSL